MRTTIRALFAVVTSCALLWMPAVGHAQSTPAPSFTLKQVGAQGGPMKLKHAVISLSLVMPIVSAGQQPMFPPTVSPFADQTTWLLTRPFRYQILETDLMIDVPAGFVTDFASIPRSLWTLASPHGFYSRASIIHDFLYWDQRCTREQADRIMLVAMQESAVGFAERQAIYAGVRAGGQSSWDANTTARAQGLLRTVPAQFINQVQPLDTWADFRARLMKQGAQEAPRPSGPPPSYCTAGN